MEPINISQQTQKNSETVSFQTAAAEQITAGHMQQDQQQMNGLEIQKKPIIIEQFSATVPLRSQELKEQLKAGPPPALGKFQKIRWTSTIKQRIQVLEQEERSLIQQQALFFAPGEQLLDDMVRRKNALRSNATTEQIADTFSDCMRNTAAVATQKLVSDSASLSPEVAALKDLFTELSACEAQTFTQAQAKDYTARYHSLGMEVNASTSRYLDEAGTMDPASCYIILYHCVAQMLQYHLNTLRIDQVDTTEFSKLYAQAAASGLAAGTMVLSQDYQDRRKAHLEQLAAIAAEKERRARQQELLRASRKQYLYTGTSAAGRASAWPLAPYASIAERCLGETLYTCSDKDLGLSIQRMEEHLETNTAAVRIFYHDQMKESPALAGMQEVAIHEILLNLGNALLRDQLEPSSAMILDAFKKFTEDHADQLTLYENRLNQLKAMPPLDLLSAQLSHIEITNMIYHQETPKAFEAAAALLQKQAQKNIDIATELIAEKISYKNRSAAVQFVIDHIGQLLLLAAPSVVFMETEYLLDYLYQFAPQIAYAENLLRQQLQDAGIDPCWASAVSKHLADTNTPVGKESLELQKLKESIDTNQQTFDQAVQALKKSSAQWQALFQWQAENITLSANAFANSLSELLQKDAKGDGELTSTEYTNGQRKEKSVSLQKTDISNIQLLRGKDLCEWSGFDDFLKGEEDAVMDALSQALSENLIALPCLKNVHTLNDLELLPLQDFTDLLTLLRSNIGKALAEWKNIASPYPKEMQERLLKDLICGKLTKENIALRIAQEEVLLHKQAEAERLRFLSFMGADPTVTGEVRYLHLKDTATTAISGEPSRAVRRNQRFQAAENLWKQIQEKDLENVLHSIWVSAQGNKSPFDFMQSIIDQRIDAFNSKNKAGSVSLKEKTEADKLIELRKLLSKNTYTLKKDQNFEREFMLRGMGGELLSFTSAGEAFTSQNRDVYDETLLQLEKIAIPRYEELDRLLKKIFTNDSKQVKSYHDKVKKMLAGIEPLNGSKPTSEQQKRNRARFGVSSWEDALTEIEKLLIPENTPLQQQAKQAAALFSKRKEQLISYKGGVLKPFCDLILQNQESFQVLMTGEDEGVSHYLSVLEKQFQKPYEALKRYHPEGIFAQEFIIEKKALFWDKKNESLDFWKQETESYYRAYCSYGVTANASIDHRYQELLKSNPALAPYLMLIIFADADGISMLLDSSSQDLSRKLKAFEEQINANNSSLDSFLSQRQADTAPALLTGFRLYLQTKIPFMETKAFIANLPKWWKDFQELDAVTQQEAKKSSKVLSQRAQIMLRIESRKQRGIAADRADQALMAHIQAQTKYGASPVFLALGQKKRLDTKAYSAKKEAIAKKYSEQPAIIRDILLESRLLGTSTKQLTQEAAWLASTYQKISDTVFPVGDSSIHLYGDVAKELLIVTFTKWKAGKESTLEDSFCTLADCHRLLQELAAVPIQDAGLVMERDHLTETLAAGMYLMEKSDFDAFITRKISYLKASSLALNVFWEETKDFPKEQIALCSGLREYFHEELRKGDSELNLPALREQTKELLKNQQIRRFLINSSSLMEQVSSTDDIRLTSSHHTLAQKSDLESYLSSLPDHAAFQSYVQLDLAQRQIFAMALSAPGQEELQLPTARFLKDENLIHAFHIQMQEQLHQYITHNTFTPVVDYTSALSQLQKPDGTINQKAFQRAMRFTNAVISQRLQNIPVNWDRLSDSASTYIAAKRFKGETADSKQLAVTSAEEFLQRLNTADKKSTKANTLKKELQSLSQHQLQLLVHALTDRTILDRSTKITAKERAKGVLHAYANTEKRAELMHLLIHDPFMTTKNALSSQALSAAMASLMSYQLRDDITLTGRSLQQNDFAPAALKRQTTIDWNLLSEALAFMHDVEQEMLRSNAIKQADVLIQESKNEAAIKEYHIQQNAALATEEDFEKYLQTQAKKDGMAALYAGYQQLDQQERALFIKALSQRQLLDISKQDINLNRLGLIEREYADAEGRNELLNEYMEASLTKGGTVALDEAAYRQAVYMTLSTQISDDVDFTKMKDQSLAACLTSFSNPFKSVRSTAVDWKLVQRALQFVHRAGNEKDIFHQDRELYVSQGNLFSTGRFSFDAAHLRKNIHNSGSRFSRYLRRRLQDNLLDQIPAYLKPVLQQAVTMGREQLSASRADQITRLGIFDDSEKQSITETASTLMEWEDGFYKDFLKSSAKTADHDQKQTKKASWQQTPQQQELSKKAIGRNLSLQEQGRKKAYERQADTIIDTVAKVIGTAAVEDNLLEAAVTESGKLINFIRNYVNDKSSIVKFFQGNGELEKMRNAYDHMEWEGEKEALNDIELIRQMKGYENYTELASFVGLNITRSLLFCASKQNPQTHLRYLAVATLATIGRTDAIGHQDAETAERVFDALMGSEYR